MENFEQRKYGIMDGERKNMSPEELAELEKKMGKANAISEEDQRERMIRETEEGIEEALHENK